MTDPHWSYDFWNSAPKALIGGLAVGGGAMAIKNLINTLRNPSDRDQDIPKVVAPVTKVPVELTEEEMAELKRREAKVAADTSFLNSIGLGALATGGALAGWHGVGALLARYRKDEAEDRLRRTKERLAKVMADNPEVPDVPLHAQMKAAEDRYFAKQSSVVDGAVNLFDRVMPTPLGALLGGGAVLAGVHGVRQFLEGSKEDQKRKKIQEMLGALRTQTPVVVMDPVVASQPAPK